MRLLRLLAALCAPLTLLAAAPAKPVDVAVRTSLGSFVLRLDPAHAPVTVANFLRYVDGKKYDGAAFYRTVVAYPGEATPRIQIIQGGLEGSKTNPDALPKIPVEKTATTGLHNVAGTIAMARTNEPVSATSEFFINVGDDRVLDSDKFPDHEGYAVFGKVVRGMDVVEKIQHAPAQRNAMGAALDPRVKILSIRRVR